MTYKTIDHIFSRDFKNMMKKLKSPYFNIYQIPIPKIPTLSLELKQGEIVRVKNIKEPFYEILNKTTATVIKDTIIKSRVVLSDGSFWVKNGEYVYQDINVKQGFKAIASTTNIKLRNTITTNTITKPYKPTDGYRYVDFYLNESNEKCYIYIVPEVNLYPQPLFALIITQKQIHKHFKGYKLALQCGHYIYLYFTPYKSNKGNQLLLGVKTTPNFINEVKHLLNFWQQHNIIFDPQITQLDDQINCVTNLGYQTIVGTLDIDDYKPQATSLAQSTNQEEQEQAEIS